MKKYSLLSLLALVCSLSFAVSAYAADTDLPPQADWTPLTTGVNREFSQIACPDARTCYVVSGLYYVGGSGGIIKTTDGGTTFASLSIPSSDPLHGISCPSAQVCFAAGDFGVLLKTLDGGATWDSLAVGSKSNRPSLTALFAIDGNRVIVVGRDGFISRTIDGGATFAPPSLRSLADFSDIYFTDAQNGFITGNDGTLFKTTDGGDTWQARGTLSSAGSILTLRASGRSTLYAVGDTLFKSTDGGETWGALHAGSLETYRTIAVTSDQTAYLVSVSNTMYKTTDGGATWSSDTSLRDAILRSVACPTPEYCIAVGAYGKAFRLGTPPPAPPPPPAPVASSTSPALEASTATSTTPTRSKAELQAELEKTLAFVASLTAQANADKATQVAASIAAVRPVAAKDKTSKTAFSRTLKKGVSGADVKRLQEILAKDTTVYPEGEASGYFGPATLRAVQKFQEKYTISVKGKSGYGQVGPATAKKLLELAQ